MPSEKEVDVALDREDLSKALYKLERFARAQNFTDLAEWSKRELRGYYDSSKETKDLAFEYRTVGVQWLDMYCRPMLVDSTLSFIHSIPVQEGVSVLEPFAEKGYSFRQDYFQELFAPITTTPVVAAFIPSEQLQALFARIRLEAQTRFHDAVPSITMSNSEHKTPWGTGSFYVFALALLVAVFVIAFKEAGVWAFPLVAIAAVLGVSIVGALQLRHDDKLSEKSFLELMVRSLGMLPLLNKSKENTKTEKSIEKSSESKQKQVK